ncbi:amidophosphoribosyltransferase [Odoribacter sp. Z80]|uniref:amidophosphoribosyltransferase n=1 Tax=Odoribacter sp. Z80 TaxID=2304575 RepID=UPI00137A48A5|nr:amidophosphoribosyltransferase [Odoribacter sp. Z80]NCE72682.1 amidophosphoribosyltransferase [Odoribacter sp. Z80]
MSDAIKHECGIAMVRLLKPLEYYHQKYGDALWGLNKLYLLMEKQHNRGQEGAGMATVKLNACPGEEYIFRERAEGTGAIQEIFSTIGRAITDYRKVEPEAVPESLPFAGEMYMGHLRYSTTGRSGISYLHPFLRRNNWRSRNLSLAGNFNLTNVDEIMSYIVERGQHPRHNADTFIILEQLGYLLDDEVERLYRRFKEEGLNGQDINEAIENNIDIEHILREASALWDGGYVITGLTGSGDMFAFRDPQGIRPAFYYVSEEVIVVASERPVIQTVFDLKVEDVCELLPGQSIVVKRNGSWKLSQIHPALNVMPCSFERIYFSRGSDCDIYKERKELGRLLTEDILKQVGYDLDHTVFSFIPNTAEIAYYGMMQGLEAWLDRQKCEMICEQKDLLTCGQIREILAKQVRTEKLAIKDIKLRTFIAEGNSRNDLAAHVYDTTYGTVREGQDSIVVIDDSIVRGTTLRQSIIKILCRHRPRRIVIVSSSPQIRYPDCYGIDMSRMGEFIAFHAAVALLKERGMEKMIKEVYDKSKAQVGMPKEKVVNYVKEIYAPFTDEEISLKIAQMITPEDCPSEIRVIYQSIENLHKACPKHRGDWYFSGNYPTPGGNRLVNKAYVDWYELTGSH